MPTKTETFVDPSGRRHTVEYDDRPIGGGTQGQVFVVRKVGDRGEDDHLLKIYSEPTGAVKHHAAKFVEHLNSHRLHKEGLAGLPRRCVTFENGEHIAVFMAYVPGQTMEAKAVYKWLQGQSLQVRLELARQVAHSIETLHGEPNIVHADIAEPNVMLDAPNLCTYLIDADGGGILDRNGQYQLKPVVQGHPTASWMAPELYAGRDPSQDTDNWSLAVLTLKMLVPNPTLDPFGGLKAFVHCRDPEIRWPDYQAVNPAKQGHVDIIKRELPRLGPRLREGFVDTFDIHGRLDNPGLRTLSTTWRERLDIAGRWCFACECGQPVVANRVTRCVFCNEPLKHAQVTVGAKTQPIYYEGFSLVGRHFGFRDRDDGRYEVLRFSRVIKQNRSILSMKNFTEGKFQELDSGVHKINVRSSNGRSRAVARVTVT